MRYLRCRHSVQLILLPSPLRDLLLPLCAGRVAPSVQGDDELAVADLPVAVHVRFSQ